jgi:hypothetical protein
VSIEDAIAEQVKAAVREALVDQLPRYGFSYDEAGEVLGCSGRSVRRMVDDGLLDLVPYANARVTIGSIRRLVGLTESPAGLHLVDELDAS